MSKSAIRNPKSAILKALFAEAKRLGIDQETLREDIAPGVIGKRLSQARPQEVARVLDHIRGITHPRPSQEGNKTIPSQEGNKIIPSWEGKGVGRKRYESSRQGLIQEIIDIAKARFGEDYAQPLNAFCARFGETDGFRKMRVNQMKIVKQRLKELQKDDPWLPPPTPSGGGQVSPAGGGVGGG